MNLIKKTKLFIGPMSKNVIDGIIEFSNEHNLNIGFIPSRRQIDFNKGYVCNWTTENLKQYIKDNKNIILERDHGGPFQGTFIDNGLQSLEDDCKYMNIIHIDPWKKYNDYIDGLNETIRLLNYCYDLNNNLYFEISTEEAIRYFSVDELENLIIDIKSKVKSEIFSQIVFLVIQSGTRLQDGKNIGLFNKTRFNEMITLCKKYGFLSKEHNGDWIDIKEVNDKFKSGLDAINIAPEFGSIETKIILSFLTDEQKQRFYDICYNSMKWTKWVSGDFDPLKDKIRLIEICGHYVFSLEDFIKLKNEIINVDIDYIIKKNIKDKLQLLVKAF